MAESTSELYGEEGQLWLRVSPGHSVSEHWLQEQAPDLYAQWRGAPSLAARDEVALQIEGRLEVVWSAQSWDPMALRHQQPEPAPVTPLSDRIGAYEAAAPQASGDALRDEVAVLPAGESRELLTWRLDSADLVADRPVIEAIAEVPADRLAVAALAGADGGDGPRVCAEQIRGWMVAEDPHAALRADVLLAVVAAGHDLVRLRESVARGGVDLGQVAPALAPACDFYARHSPAIEAMLDREIAAGGFRDAASDVASWPQNRPTSPSLHDTERAIVEHVVGSVIAATDPAGQGLWEAARMWERAADRAELREWGAALDRGAGPDGEVCDMARERMHQHSRELGGAGEPWGAPGPPR